MRKHYKLVSGIACIVLCVAMIAFGVYAASTSLVKFNASVSFTPSTAKVKIFGGIAGSKEVLNVADNSKGYYANNSGLSTHANIEKEEGNVATFKTWNYGTANFNDEYTETAGQTHPDPIYFFLQITNTVEKDVDITINFADDYSDSNFSVTCSYAYAKNTEIGANSTSFYDITGTDAPLQGTTNAKINGDYDGEATISNKVVDLTNIDTTLSTVMIVIKLEVKDADESIDSNTPFNFTVTIANTSSNN